MTMMKTKTPTIKLPALPHLIDGGKWDIQQGLGSVNLPNKYLSVPFGQSEYEQAVRAHEYGHIKYSPDVPPNFAALGIDIETVRAIEDGRINSLLHRNDVEIINHLVSKERGEELCEKVSDVKLLGLLAIASLYTDAFSVFIHKLSRVANETDRVFIMNIIHALWDDLDNFSTVLKLAKMYDQYFAKKPEYQKAIEYGRPGCDFSVGGHHEGDTKIMDKILKHNLASANVNWGKLKEVKYHKLRKPIPGAIRQSSKKRYGEYGAMVYPHRIYPMGDSTVFAYKKRVLGGTILIDVSGSMRLKNEHIDAIVNNAPACTVAIYSGYNYEGRIHVIARKGYRVEEIPSTPSNNIIDGPALEWLVKQDRPYIWVSDGIVTGINDRICLNLVTQCKELIIRHGIIQIETPNATVDYFKALRKKLKL